jgi:hypothetical protein
MSVELYRPEISKALLKFAEAPIAQSVLYDLDFLPEQLNSQKNLTIGLFAAYNRLEGFLLAFAAMDLYKESEGD